MNGLMYVSISKCHRDQSTRGLDEALVSDAISLSSASFWSLPPTTITATLEIERETRARMHQGVRHFPSFYNTPYCVLDSRTTRMHLSLHAAGTGLKG